MMNYKKNVTKIFTCLFIISVSGISHAQKISYGIKGGLNLSETQGTYYQSYSKTGFNMYAFADYNTSEKFSISAEAGYTQKGFKTASSDYYLDGVHYNGNINAKLNYIDISVSAKIKITTGKFIPYLLVGPSFGIKVSDGTSATGNANEYSRGDVQSLLDNVNSNSLGIKLGAGAEISIMKNSSIIFEARYNFDLIPSYKAPGLRLGINTWFYSDNVRNSVFEFLAGVKF